MQRGFTLVELAIVLTIIGLIIGGVLVGSDLIKSAQLNAVATEYRKYVAAVNTFRDKYQYLPGDMPNATTFWGKDNTNCPTNTGNVGTPGTCNGSGDGMIDYGSAGGATGEMFQFWKQLALAGLIEGSYSGLAGPVDVWDTVPGTDSPASRMANAGWGVAYIANYGGDAATYAYDYGNFFAFGGTVSGNMPYAAVLSPADAFNIDTKLDDGEPAHGKVISRRWSTCATSTSNTDYTGAYNLANTSLQCTLYFIKQF